MAANRPRITQEHVAKAVGVSQSWVSQYKSGDVDADIDQLDAMARVFGHTLNELFDLRPDPKERDLIDAYRAIEATKRPLAVDVVKALVTAPPAPPRKRTG
jgi:transcriptional regulator with XRE-family HTH domain